MRIQRTLEARCGADALFTHVDDLERYPGWMDLVHAVERVDPVASDPPTVPIDGAAAWSVELRAKVGPLARSKQLRMVRTCHEPSRHVRFERAEVDGRAHSPWTLDVTLDERDESEDAPTATTLTMTLEYGGRLWTGAALQLVLDDHVRSGSAALAALVDLKA